MPALIVLLATLLAGGLALAFSTGDSAATRAGGPLPATATMAQLELAIANDTTDARTWFLYGERLREAGRFVHATQAYQKALEQQPYHREARFDCALALAQSGDSEAFYTFMRDVTLNYAKMAVDLFERRETQAYLSQPRFQEMRREAQNLAMD